MSISGMPRICTRCHKVIACTVADPVCHVWGGRYHYSCMMDEGEDRRDREFKHREHVRSTRSEAGKRSIAARGGRITSSETYCPICLASHGPGDRRVVKCDQCGRIAMSTRKRQRDVRYDLLEESPAVEVSGVQTPDDGVE